MLRSPMKGGIEIAGVAGVATLFEVEVAVRLQERALIVLGGRALLQLVGAQLVAVVHGQPAVGQPDVHTQLAAVLDQEVLVGRAGPELQHARVVAVGGLEGAGPERHRADAPVGERRGAQERLLDAADPVDRRLQRRDVGAHGGRVAVGDRAVAAGIAGPARPSPRWLPDDITQ